MIFTLQLYLFEIIWHLNQAQVSIELGKLSQYYEIKMKKHAQK